ncbi:MAG: GerMN domain-containing protein [Lachnospira sp.]|nr:GerMN domain-containing protein [Lachnospira sp.]
MRKTNIAKKFILLSFILLSVFGLVACGKEKTGQSYDIYYMNSDGNKLLKQEYRTEETDQEKLVQELYDQMNTRQKNDKYIVIKPDQVRLNQIEIQDGIVSLIFNDSYYEMKTSREVLFRSAVVKSICQVEGIDYVKFVVGANEAVYEDGTAVGLMNEESFANDSTDQLGNIEWRNINLYFANKVGDRLIKDEVSVAYGKNISLEKVIVEKLIKGPSKTGEYATLPADMKLLNISVNNKTCYVNLSSEFSTEMVNVSAMIPVYSIVNSLCELDTIDNVKILINGNSTKAFRESVNLDTTLNFNAELIQ